MASHDQQLRNPRYRDWVKAGLALKYLKDGIEEFVDDETKEQQKSILQEVQKEIGRPGVTCNSCPIDQLRAYKQGRYKKSNRCPNDVCDRIFDKIVEQHMYGRPSWSNTDSTKWCTDHWEIAKCFVDGGGYGDKAGAADTDCKGLLSVITNSMFVQRNVDTPIDRFEPKTDVFSKSKEARNEILHLASLQLPVETLNGYIDVMIQLLEDKGKLYEHDNAKQAILKLRQLKETDLYISTENEWEIREEALKAIQERKQDALDEIEKKQNEILEKLQIDKIQETLDELSKTSKETSQSFSGRHESLEQRQTVLESTLKQTMKFQKEASQAVVELQQDLSNLKKDLSDLKTRFDAFDEIKLQHKIRLTYLDHKKVVRQELDNLYDKYLSNIQVPPVLQKLDATVDEFYVELEVCDDDVYEKRKIDKKKKNYNSEIVKNYREIFYKEGNRVENIYVLGDAGVGKTTWCLKLINSWLRCPPNHKTESTHSISLNEHMMLEFDFVLFVSLRHASKDVNLTDMIQNQIFHQTPHMFEYMQEVINTEPDRCLVIADGLDEWNAPDDQITSGLGNNPSFPSRKNMNHCTVLTTTRPWKLNEINPSFSLIDRAVIIRGFGGKYYVRKLAERVIHKLNQNASREMSPKVENENSVENFELELHNRFLSQRFKYGGSKFHKMFPGQRFRYNESVTQIPLILILMVVKWYHDGALEKNMAGNYSFLLKSLLEHEEGYRNIKRRYGRKQKFDGRLSSVSYLEEAKREWSKDAEKLPECVKKHAVCCQYSRLILKLSEIAFEGLFERNDEALIFSEEILQEKLSTEEVEVGVKSGILSKSDVVGHCDVSKLSFLHKTVQEFLAAIHLVALHEDNILNSYQKFEKHCFCSKRIYEMENVILFCSGLDTKLAIKILKHVSYVENQDSKSNFFDFVVKCIEELKDDLSVVAMPMLPLNSFIPIGKHDFDRLLGLLETRVDKGSIRQVKVDLQRNYRRAIISDDRQKRLKTIVEQMRLGLHRLFDILASEKFPLFSLTTLQLKNISGKCLYSRTNKRMLFKLHNLRNLELCRIDANDKDEEGTKLTLDFSHSRNIKSIELYNLSSCQINFRGSNLTELNLKRLKHCHVSINDDVALQVAENVNLNCKLRFFLLKATLTSLTCTDNKFCEVEIDTSIHIESVILKKTDTAPKINWQEVTKVVLECKGRNDTFFMDVLYGISCSPNLINLQCTGFDQDVYLEIMKTIGSVTNLNNLKISGLDTLKTKVYCHFNIDMKYLELKLSGWMILENIDNNDVETLKLSLVPSKNGIKLVQSLVNLKCLICQGYLERDFIVLGEYFQYLKNLEELELSNFCWIKVENPDPFSCLENIECLKALSLKRVNRTVISAISVNLPRLSLSELLYEGCNPNLQCLMNMKMLKKLTIISRIGDSYSYFTDLMQNLKQIKYLIFRKPVINSCYGIKRYTCVLEKIQLSEFTHLEHFMVANENICSDMWQTFVKGLPKNDQLQTLEFQNAVINDIETERMIKSTPGFVCKKWEHVLSKFRNKIKKYDIKLKANKFTLVIYDRADFVERQYGTYV